MLVYKSFRYRIYPTIEQAARLDRWSDALRFLWNIAHEQRLIGLAHPHDYRRYHTAFSQSNELTDLRTELPWLADVPRNVSMKLLADLHLAWQRCFKRTAARPRWKIKGVDVISCTETNPNLFHLDRGTLRFSKIGSIRAIVHRSIVGKLKTCTIKRDGDQWFCSIMCEIEIADPIPSTKPPIGIDRGCVNLIADSNGRIVENPRHLQQLQQRMSRADRNVSRKKKGSKNREKAKVRSMRLNRKVRRQRDHVLHCESKSYAESQGMIFVERLQIQNMAAKGGAYKKGLNRSIMSAGWGRFVDFCRYKIIRLGGSVDEVSAPGTSQECSLCHVIDARNRISQSVFCCVACGHHEHADINAAKVILHRGLTAVEPTVTVCGGLAEVRLPKRQKVRAARRGTRS